MRTRRIVKTIPYLSHDVADFIQLVHEVCPKQAVPFGANTRGVKMRLITDEMVYLEHGKSRTHGAMEGRRPAEHQRKRDVHRAQCPEKPEPALFRLRI